jgi:1-acyl-sn-glycerol-3-phosphate acyltransferase
LKGFVYSLVKLLIKTGLYGYHKRIVVSGLENIPKDKPVLFLPNHQSALIDVLLIATDCNRKPFFLTRADVFKSKFLKEVFSYFKMLPIYRMRDGRETLSNNNLIFDMCADILNRDEALVIFPEANHNLRRTVRPLSKGFTRIILRSFELHPNLDIQLVPVGLNYKNAVHFPDEVAVYYGKPISARNLFNANDLKQSSDTIKNIIFAKLKILTAHIPNNQEYEVILHRLRSENINFLAPTLVNEKVKSFTQLEVDGGSVLAEEKKTDSFKIIFSVLNFLIVLIWRLWLRSKVPEAEFMGTFRFAFGFLFYPIYLLMLLMVLSICFNLELALLIIGSLTVINVLLVKIGMR